MTEDCIELGLARLSKAPRMLSYCRPASPGLQASLDRRDRQQCRRKVRDTEAQPASIHGVGCLLYSDVQPVGCTGKDKTVSVLMLLIGSDDIKLPASSGFWLPPRAAGNQGNNCLDLVPPPVQEVYTSAHGPWIRAQLKLRSGDGSWGWWPVVPMPGPDTSMNQQLLC